MGSISNASAISKNTSREEPFAMPKNSIVLTGKRLIPVFSAGFSCDIAFDLTIYLLQSMLKKEFADKEPAALRRLMEEMGAFIRCKEAEAPAGSESK